MSDNKSKMSFPHVYILMLTVMLIVVAMSWVIPSGEFARVQDPNTGRKVIDPDEFRYLEESDPISVMDFFVAIHKGIMQAGDIIVMLLMAGGAIYMVQQSGAIDAGIHKMLSLTEGKESIVIFVLTLVFAILGTIGMGEGGLPFVPIAVSMVAALGYDKITGFAVSMGAMGIGFAAGILNLFTTGIAQSIVGLPLFSGIAFRTASFVIFYIITIIYILNYAKRISNNPSKSIVANHYKKQLEKGQEAHYDQVEFTLRRKLALIGLVFVFVFQGYGAIQLGWGLQQISGLYLIFAFVLAIITTMTPNKACENFAKGAANLLPAGLAIGLARSIMVLMNQAKIIDPAIHRLSLLLEGKSSMTVLLLIYISVIIFNFFVISGSGKAVIMMPILGPLGRLLSINQQVMVLLYNFGDGFTNYLYPTSGGLMAGLAMVDIEWNDWFKFAWKLMFILMTVAFGLILIAHYIQLGPF